MKNDAEAKLQGRKDSEDSKKSKRGKLSLLIVVSGQVHETDCLNNYRAELSAVQGIW